jgi:hypothetical protein
MYQDLKLLKFLAQLENIVSMESRTLVCQAIFVWEVRKYRIQLMEHLAKLVTKVITV